MSVAKGYRQNKGRMLSLARRRLGAGKGKKQAVFEAAARHLNEAWDGTKAHGYELVYRVVAKHKGTPLPKGGRPRPSHVDVSEAATADFLQTYEWRRLRMEVLKERGARCECCGATPKDGVRMNVDHIKPRKLFPALALDKANLQILCEVCNHGKGNWDQTDWRADQPVKVDEPQPKDIPALAVSQTVVDMRPRLVRKGA